MKTQFILCESVIQIPYIECLAGLYSKQNKEARKKCNTSFQNKNNKTGFLLHLYRNFNFTFFTETNQILRQGDFKERFKVLFCSVVYLLHLKSDSKEGLHVVPSAQLGCPRLSMSWKE